MQIAAADMQEAFEAQNPEYATGRQRKQLVRFYMNAVLDEQATNGWTEQRWDPDTGKELKSLVHPGAGRPIYREEEWVEIRTPGDKDEIRQRAVRPGDKVRFATEYHAFKEGKEAPSVGTPLDQLPFLTQSQRLEFQALGVKTAEHLRDMPDTVAQKFMGIQQIRKRVADYLAAAEGARPTEELNAQLAKRDEEIEALRKMLKEQGDAIAEMKKGKK